MRPWCRQNGAVFVNGKHQPEDVSHATFLPSVLRRVLNGAAFARIKACGNPAGHDNLQDAAVKPDIPLNGQHRCFADFSCVAPRNGIRRTSMYC